MKARAHVHVSGRVQGVFFRSSVAELAESLHVTGWIRNLYDGRVESVIEGEKDDLERVVEFCRRGPPGAHVHNLDLKWEEWSGEFSDFRVLH
jgi:acylphosphatase